MNRIYEFADPEGRQYQFKFDKPDKLLYSSQRQSPYESIANGGVPIVEGKPVWRSWDYQFMSPQARDYAERLIKLVAFL